MKNNGESVCFEHTRIAAAFLLWNAFCFYAKNKKKFHRTLERDGYIRMLEIHIP